MTERGEGGQHRAPTPPGRTARFARRDTLAPESALRATRFTRLTFATTDVLYGAGFLVGAPTNSATYRAMQNALATVPMVGPYTGMWVWGLLLVAAGLLIPFGQIAAGAPIGVFAWSGFAVFNVLSLSGGAWAAPLFAGLAVIHVGMGWYIVRDRRRTRQASRARLGAA